MSKATDIDSIPMPEPEPKMLVSLPTGKDKTISLVCFEGENDVKQAVVKQEGDIQSDVRSDGNKSSRLDARPVQDISLFKRAITEATKDSVARDKYGKLSQSIVDDMFKDFLAAKMHQIESEYQSKKESGGKREGNATEEDVATSVEEMSKLLDAEINQLNAGQGETSLGRTPSVTTLDTDGTEVVQNIKIEVSTDSVVKDNSNSNPGKAAPSAGSKKLGFMNFGIRLSAASTELISSGERHDKTGRRLEEAEDTSGSNALKGEVSSYSGSSGSGSGDDDDNGDDVSGTGSLSDSDKDGKSSKSKKKRKRKHKHKHKKKHKNSKEKDKADGFDEKDKDRERSTISKRKTSHRSRSRSKSPKRSRRSRSRSGSRSRFRDERRSRSRSGERELPRSDRFGEFDAHVYRNYRRNVADNDRFRERHGGRSHSSSVSKEKRSRSRSQERKVEDQRLKIDKAKLREIAIKNALANAQTGQGPKIDVTLKAGGKSVEELTNFCKRIASKESKIGAEHLNSSSDEGLAAVKSDDDDSLIHHPFKMKQHANIVMDIRNAKQLPVLSPAERAEKSAQLRIQFPVSSGSVHRMKEEWIPVETTISATATKTTVTTSIAKSMTVTPPQVFVPTLPPPPPPPPDDKVFPDPPAQDIDISAIISERLHAVRKLQENPYDPVAQSVMAQAQQRASLWAQSKLLPGQFLGSTGATILSQQELMGPDKKRQAWAKKDQFTNAAPLQGGIGMYLLQKMGWKQGEGLGKNNEGTKEPLILDFKVDRKGLKSSEEGPKKQPPGPRVKDLSGKHPVSALVEFCNKRKWGQPQFEVVQETGPDHKKSFLFKVRLDPRKLVVAAIDFGTTFSSWAFSFTHDYRCNPTKMSIKSWNSGKGISQKAPTTVLIRPDGKTLEAFGYKAEDMYAELVAADEHRQWYYFTRFKMALYMDKQLNRRKEIADEMGRELPAMTVICLVIDHLRKDLLLQCCSQISGAVSEDSIHWVLTVPAIWNDKARRFMREAATVAGIPAEHLTIALEPEAASIYCRQVPLQSITAGGKKAIVPLPEGTRYIVIDAGGGTIDITVHEVMGDGNLKELHKATGGACGGQEVDGCFKQFLIKIFGGPVLQEFKKEAMDDYIGIFRDFELKKRSVDTDVDGKFVLSLPLTLVEIFEKHTQENLTHAIAQAPFASKLELRKGNKLRIDNSLMKDFFDKAVKSAVNHIQAFYDSDDKYGISVALLVGGFSESPMLSNTLRNIFPSWNFVVPDDAGLVVLKGAVLFGHNPSAVTYRICRYTYGTRSRLPFQDGVHPEELLYTASDGTRHCTEIFMPLIEEGTLFKCGDIIYDKFIWPLDDKDYLSVHIYTSSDKNAKYTTDDCCTRLGKLRVDQLNRNTPRTQRRCRLTIFFGSTDLYVECTDINTGTKLTASFDILE